MSDNILPRLPELLDRDQRAGMNRAEIIKLHDMFWPDKRIGPKTLAADLPFHALADAMRGRMPLGDYDVRRFPYQDYEWFSCDGLTREREQRSGMVSIPFQVPIEIERIIGPFFARWQYVVCWKQEDSRFVTLVTSRELMQSILGRVWGWGWPLKGQIVDFMSGPVFVADPPDNR